MSEFQTNIGEIVDGEYQLRGKNVTDLMDGGDWLGTICLTLIGRALKEYERPVLAACLIGALDHGLAPPSAHVTRVIASCGKPLADSVAGGLLTLGPRHGNAAGAAALWLKEQLANGVTATQAAKITLDNKIRLAGFGHAEYERDPRALKLAELVKQYLPTHPHVSYALEVAEELTRQKGKPLYLNIDGAIGAIIADLDLPSEVADAFFLIARTVGLSAHALEEANTSKTYYRQGGEIV